MTRQHALRVIAALVVAVVVAGALAFDTVQVASLTGRQAALTSRAVDFAHATLRVASEIQAERIYLLDSTCEAQNRRHDRTIRELDVLLRRAARHAKRRQRAAIHAKRAGTVLLINQLAPYQNCRRLIRVATSHPPVSTHHK